MLALDIISKVSLHRDIEHSIFRIGRVSPTIPWLHRVFGGILNENSFDVRTKYRNRTIDSLLCLSVSCRTRFLIIGIVSASILVQGIVSYRTQLSVIGIVSQRNLCSIIGIVSHRIKIDSRLSVSYRIELYSWLPVSYRIKIELWLSVSYRISKYILDYPYRIGLDSCLWVSYRIASNSILVYRCRILSNLIHVFIGIVVYRIRFLIIGIVSYRTRFLFMGIVNVELVVCNTMAWHSLSNFLLLQQDEIIHVSYQPLDYYGGP